MLFIFDSVECGFKFRTKESATGWIQTARPLGARELVW